jgi:hypothetical protein
VEALAAEIEGIANELNFARLHGWLGHELEATARR